MKSYVALAVGIFAGQYLAGFLIKDGPNDPTGFVEKSDGIGLDDFVAVASIMAGVIVAKKLIG